MFGPVSTTHHVVTHRQSRPRSLWLYRAGAPCLGVEYLKIAGFAAHYDDS